MDALWGDLALLHLGYSYRLAGCILTLAIVVVDLIHVHYMHGYYGLV